MFSFDVVVVVVAAAAAAATYTTISAFTSTSTIFTTNPGGRTGLVVRASDSGSGDPGSILGRSVCCFLETFTPQKYW